MRLSRLWVTTTEPVYCGATRWECLGDFINYDQITPEVSRRGWWVEYP